MDGSSQELWIRASAGRLASGFTFNCLFVFSAVAIIVSCCSFSFLMAFCIDGYYQTTVLCSCFNSRFTAARKNCLWYRVLYGS